MSQVINKLLLNRTTIRQVLRAWNDLSTLGQHPLRNLKVVQAWHQKLHRSSATYAYGLSLSEIVRKAVDQMKPTGEANFENRRWRTYLILHKEYLEGEFAEDVADKFAIAIRTYQEWKANALDQLVGLLRAMEDQQIEIDLSEQTSAPFLAPTKPAIKMVGRDNILADLKNRLFAGSTLAISALNGIPGIGKTALAIELTNDPDVIAHFRDGILWARLGRKPYVFRELGIWGRSIDISTEELAKLMTIEERAEAIHAAIGLRRMLLISDDAWQLDAALAFRLGGPNCAHLLTTRFPNIAKDFAEEGASSITPLTTSAGQELFLQIAPEVNTSDANTLVQIVGGSPLAIILMATNARSEASKGRTHLREIVDKLRSAKERLTLERPQTPADRHPSLPLGTPISLQASIGISYESIDKSAQQTLKALSVFPPKPNSFSLDAALAVSAKSSTSIHSLVDHGLIEHLPPNRLILHQTIADYASEKHIDSRIYARMVEYSIGFIENHKRDYDKLDTEIDNILAAIEVASEKGMAKAFVLGINALYSYFDMRGLYELAMHYLGRTEQVAVKIKDHSGQTTTLLYLGQTAKQLGNYAQAKTYYEEGLLLARKLGSQDRVSSYLVGLGALAGHQGNYKEEEEYYQQGLSIARELGLQKNTCDLLVNLGTVALDRGDYEQSETYSKEGLSIAQEIGDTELEIDFLINLGASTATRGIFPEAKSYLNEALVQARSLNFRERIIYALWNLAGVSSGLEKSTQAILYLQEALEIAREIGHRTVMSTLLWNLGTAMYEAEDYEHTESPLYEGLALARDLGQPWVISGALISLGNLYTEQGKCTKATDMLEEALGIAQEIGVKEYEAKALFGLARTAQAQKNHVGAEQLGRKSWIIFEEIGHRLAPEVKKWLEDTASKYQQGQPRTLS